MLTVLNVAYPFAPVGPDATGGSEQVVARLDSALTREGHRSVVLACEGSRTQGILLEVPRPSGLLENERPVAHARYRAALAGALCRAPVDVVHMHGVDFTEYLPPPGIPVLATLHLPPSWYPPKAFRLERPQTYIHCVSRAQERACPPSARLLPAIENGVAVDDFPAPLGKRGFALALGRICPEKGFHIALDAAALAGVPLLLAGEVYRHAAHERYFSREIAPRLDRTRRFLGPVDFRRKRRLLSAARCLLAPSLVEETSSLVAMEAMACGTAVIAFPSGALAEIVQDGLTGFLVSSVQEMARAISRAGDLDAEASRAAARERFPLERSIRQYLDLYLALSGNPAIRPLPAQGSFGSA